MSKLCVLIATLLLSCPAFSELVCYWKFDGNLENTGSYKCRPCVYGHIAYADGISGQSLDLSEPGGNAIILDGSEDLLNGPNAFSICFWYKGRLKDNPPWASIVSKGGEADKGWQVRLYSSEGGACFTLRGISGFSGNCFGYAKVVDDQWHHIAGVFDGRFIYLYVDGVLEEVKEATGQPGLTNSPIVIGAKITESGKEPYAFSKGLIDELRIYNHAVDREQIKQLSNYDRIIGKKFMETYRELGVLPIQAHRGGGVNLPENTLETFEWAWSERIIPEADMRTTSDGVVVCFHDTDLKRICPDMPPHVAEKSIYQMTIDEVKTLDVGKFRGKAGQRVPRLDEVFQAMSGRPERFLFLDYKYIDLDWLANAVKRYGITKQVIFTNKSHNLIMQWKRLVPQSQTMLWTGGTQDSIAKKLEALRMENYQGITMLQVHYLKTDGGYSLSDEFLLATKKELEERGIIFQVLPWRISDPAVFERLIEIGIESFATDYPDILVPIYKKKWCGLKN